MACHTDVAPTSLLSKSSKSPWGSLALGPVSGMIKLQQLRRQGTRACLQYGWSDHQICPACGQVGHSKLHCLLIFCFFFPNPINCICSRQAAQGMQVAAHISAGHYEAVSCICRRFGLLRLWLSKIESATLKQSHIWSWRYGVSPTY